MLLYAAKARALIRGRSYVLPDDILMLAPTVLGHRVLLAQTAASGRTGPDVIRAIVSRIPRSSWS